MPDHLDAWVADVVALSPGTDESAAREAGIALLARWSEPHRHYHTQQHLTEMLTALETLSAPAGLEARELSVARVAAWLHDAVYDVHATVGRSERESAALAREQLGAMGVGPSDTQAVQALILLTIDHGTELPGALADAFTDADLAILAAPADRFDAYCCQVRAEYAHVPQAPYNQARSGILSALVDRSEIYRTGFARAEWTAAARDNVRRELDRLAG